ncbi:hypothetical protein OS190_13370 [Sulfitobacter sp. F26204]|uniref:hypothetical protein n=1 Tax=Sulfitobacter sp. F26204 TaxID=2996014 RepID=UPI00225E492E|nr:hypothetical protein [Sulfitobacter sp. F26204]MCX7560561.1 hypothetical protein [Sulfitobacter sp. F26204]
MRLVVALVALFGTPCLAQAEQFGSVSAVLDGEQQDWFTISDGAGENMAASASFRKGKTLSDLSIQAHPQPRFSSKSVLSISVSFLGEYEAGKAPMTTELIYLTDGMRKPFYTSEGVTDAMSVDIELLEAEDSIGTVKGTFKSKVCLVKELYADPDLDVCKDISGSFDTQIQIR